MIHEKRYGQALARTLKTVRGKRSQKEMAALGPLPPSTWCKIEQGGQLPRPKTMKKLARACNCSLPQLEQLILQNMLVEITAELAGEDGTAGAPGSQPSEGGRPRFPDADLAQASPSAARHLASSFETIAAIRRQLDALELDVRSLGRELRASSEEGA